MALGLAFDRMWPADETSRSLLQKYVQFRFAKAARQAGVYILAKV